MATAEFSIRASMLSAALSQHHLLGFETLDSKSADLDDLFSSYDFDSPVHV